MVQVLARPQTASDMFDLLERIPGESDIRVVVQTPTGAIVAKATDLKYDSGSNSLVVTSAHSFAYPFPEIDQDN